MPFYDPFTTSGLWSSPTATASTTTGNTVWWHDTGTGALAPITKPIWVTSTTSNTAGTLSYYTMPQTAQAQMAAMMQQHAAQQTYERYWSQDLQSARPGLGSLFGSNDWQITAIGSRQLYTPSAPAIITRFDEERRDREAYDRAVAEHDDQEAARIMRQIEARAASEAERRRLIEQQQEEQRQRQAHLETAKQVARDLLLSHLSPEQRNTFERNGWFIVEGGRSKTQYRIRSRGVAGNIDVLGPGDRVTHRLCCHARDGTIPAGDQWLSQKIMLELAEDDFLWMANRHAA